MFPLTQAPSTLGIWGIHKEKPRLLKGMACPGSLFSLSGERQMFDVWLHQDSLWIEVQARDGADARGSWDEAAGAAIPLDVLQMDSTLGSAGQARLGFEDSLSTPVCVYWADHTSHCAPLDQME